MRALAIRAAALALSLGLFVSAGPARAHDESPAAQVEAKKHAGAPRSFAEKPAVGTWATCPVSGETFQIDESTKFATWKGRSYAFCCPDCKGDFTENPAKFGEGPKSKP